MQERREDASHQLVIYNIEKSETRFDSALAVADYLQQQIESNSISTFIGTFDHLSHTQALDQGQIDADIKDARNVLFCFGLTIPSPEALATRPKSIGICEMEDQIVVSYAETPMPMANSVIAGWIQDLSK